MADTKISALTSRTAPAATDVVPVAASGTTYKVSFLNLVRKLIGLEKTAGADSYIINADDNVMDSAAVSSVVTAPGSSVYPNKMGELNALPAGTDKDPGWSADSGYVSGAASYSGIVSGYDVICNAIGSTVLGNHHMISYTAEGHNTIIGNSYCWIAGGRSFIAGSNECSVRSGTNYGTIVGSRSSHIYGGGDDSSILGGVTCTIDSSNANNAIISSNTSSVTDTAQKSTVIASYGATVDGAANTIALIATYGSTVTGGTYGAIIGGYNCTLTATSAVILGGNACVAAHHYTATIGHSAKTKSAASIALAGGPLVAVGDAQADIVQFKVRTTNSTLTNMASGPGFIELDDAKKNAVCGTVFIVGIRGDTGASCGYKLDFVVDWDGTTYRINGASSETSLTEVYNGASIVTAPVLAGNTGSIRPKVTGLSGVNINWSAIVTMASVNV